MTSAFTPKKEPPSVAGRVPPNDLVAEEAVLSSILGSDGRDALDRVLDVLRPEHFYAEANQIIYTACIDLAENGRPVDWVNINTWFRERELTKRVGGVTALARLIDATPTVSHVVEYAKTVKACWRLRRAISTCQKIAAEGYGDVGDPQEWLDAAEQEIHEIARSTETTTIEPIRGILKQAFEKIQRAADNGGQITGIPTGFYDLDRKIAGLHRGELVVIAGRPGMAKAQPYDAKVLAPSGWRTMGSLSDGDIVIGADGHPKKVLGVYERGHLDVFRITTSDGASTECCGEHLWLTRTRSNRRNGSGSSVRTTNEVAESLFRNADGGLNHSIQIMSPAMLSPLTDDLPVPMDPYLLGVYLGDGSSNNSVVFDNPETDIQDRIESLLPTGDALVRCDGGLHLRVKRAIRNHSASSTKMILSELGLCGRRSWEKFIPEIYLRSTISDRVRLLQGLCDTDGHTATERSVEYSTSSPAMASGVEFLVGSLGGIASCYTRPSHYTKDGKRVSCRTSYKINIRFPNADVVPVSSAKHLSRWVGGRPRLRERYISSVEPVGAKMCRCIRVQDSLYVTDGFLVTHNTSLSLNIASNVAFPRSTTVRDDNGHDKQIDIPGYGVAFFSLEMPKEQIANRLVCADGRVDVGKLRLGNLDHTEWSMLTTSAGRISPLPIWVDDKAGSTMVDIRAKVRRVQSELRRTNHPHKDEALGLVVIDFLQLMRNASAKSREQEIASLARGAKELAKDLNVAVIALSQLNRACELREDKRPMLSDLRESGEIEQSADAVIGIFREDYYAKLEGRESSDPGVAELIVAKQRNGPTGTVRVRFVEEFTRFENLAPEYQQ